MNVEGRAERFVRHHAAFDVPPWATGAPRAVPARLARLGLFPQREVGRMAQARVALDAHASDHLVQLAARQFAVARLLLDGVVHAISRDIGAIFGDQITDVFDHLRNVVRAFRMIGDGGYVQPLEISEVLRGVALGNRQPRLAGGDAAIDDLVIDVGDVVDQAHRIPAHREPARHSIEQHRPHEVPNMAIVVHRRPAQVHADLARLQGDEWRRGASQGVVDRYRHLDSSAFGVRRSAFCRSRMIINYSQRQDGVASGDAERRNAERRTVAINRPNRPSSPAHPSLGARPNPSP